MICSERKLNRYRNWNYSDNGWYFVTFNVYRFSKCFGHIENGLVILNNYGSVAVETWNNIPHFYKNVFVDEFVIMPNHVHGIIVIKKMSYLDKVGTGHCPVRTENNYGLLSKIINGYKNIVTKEIRKNKKDFCWHRSFYDRVIRNEKEYWQIKQYIRDNPKGWESD